MSERPLTARGNVMHHTKLAASAGILAVTLSACGSVGSAEAPVIAQTVPNDVDPCSWNSNNHRALTEEGKIIIDSRCTKPTNGPTFVYSIPSQERDKAVRDANGDPLGIISGTAVAAHCVVSGQYVQNDEATGSNWWVRIDIPDPDAPGNTKGADVPEVHAGFPLHDVKPGVAVGPSSLPVCPAVQPTN